MTSDARSPSPPRRGSADDAWLRGRLIAAPDGQVGHDPELIDELSARSTNWAGRLRATYRAPEALIEADDVLTLSWFALQRHVSRIRDTEHPWAYLFSIVRREIAKKVTGDILGSDLVALDMNLARRVHEPIRFGEDSVFLEDVRVERTTERTEALERFIALLATQDARPRYWQEVVDRAVTVLARSRRSYEETQLRADPYLHALGLTKRQITALSALLIGPRQSADRHAESLLLALRSDPGTLPSAVPGAEQRLATLTTSIAPEAAA